MWVFLNVAYTGLQLGSSQTFSAPLDITIFINIIKVNILSVFTGRSWFHQRKATTEIRAKQENNTIIGWFLVL